MSTTSLVASADPSTRLHSALAAGGIAGGAVYDAMVALAARDGCVLVTRDARALGTYAAIGVPVEVIGG